MEERMASRQARMSSSLQLPETSAAFCVLPLPRPTTSAYWRQRAPPPPTPPFIAPLPGSNAVATHFAAPGSSSCVLVNEGNAAQRKVQPGRFTESSNRSVTTVTEALAESMAFFLTGSWGSTVAPVCSRGGGGDVGFFFIHQAHV